MKRSNDYVKKARQMEHLMKQQLHKLKTEVAFKEYLGFEMCLKMFQDFYSDALKRDTDEQGND